MKFDDFFDATPETPDIMGASFVKATKRPALNDGDRHSHVKQDATTEPDIFTYSEYRDFLRDYFEARRLENSKFSFRVFARQAGFATGSTPKMVLDGKRKLTIESARKFAKGLQLNKRQTSYLEALVEFEQADSTEKKAAAAHKIKALVPRHKTAVLGREFADYITNLNLVALREMLHLRDFKEEPAWIGRTIQPSMTPAEIKQAFAQLFRLGLVVKNDKGKLVPAEPIVSTTAEVNDIDVFSIHRSLLKMAEESLATVPANKRHNASLTFPVPLRKMEEIKKRILSFQQSLIELVDDGQNDFDEVFHLSIALFPVTNAKGKQSS